MRNVVIQLDWPSVLKVAALTDNYGLSAPIRPLLPKASDGYGSGQSCQ